MLMEKEIWFSIGPNMMELTRQFTIPTGILFPCDSINAKLIILDHFRLIKYGNCFGHNNFKTPGEDHIDKRPPLTLWDRTTIWNKMPEMSYAEFMESDNGLLLWLEMFHRYGIAILRGVPVTQVKTKVIY